MKRTAKKGDKGACEITKFKKQIIFDNMNVL
jgi:hypothetical protein